ncbi:MAG: TlyA family RNA methyltransferase [Micrococcales bacterium]|nr:TlyA family RNA methyltransferase [Micrococcales bacterium]
MTGRRLDAELVARGLARSRGQAKDLVASGVVRLGGQRATKTSRQVDDATPITVEADPEPWVGRAAAKLLAALQHWGPRGALRGDEGGIRHLDPHSKRCLDVGASTGGFTQVLLAHEAAHVTALDVGRGQLVAALAADPRVRDLPGTNIRDVAPGDLDALFDIVVADLSFISLRIVLPMLMAQLTDDGDLVVLVKPQFEVGRGRLGQAGVVRSAHEHRRVLRDLRDRAAGLGLTLLDVVPSPITGGHGNREFLCWLVRATAASRPVGSPVDDGMLDEIVGQAIPPSTEGVT